MKELRSVVDREGFKLWSQGILLERHGTDVTIVPSTDCEQAFNALERSECIGLTINGQIVSTMSERDGSFVEELYV